MPVGGSMRTQIGGLVVAASIIQLANVFPAWSLPRLSNAAVDRITGLGGIADAGGIRLRRNLRHN